MPQFPSFIFGMHDRGAEQLFLDVGKPGWIVISVKVNPPDTSGDFSALANARFGVIVRLNNGYNPDGTLPDSSQYDTFAHQCADFVAASSGARIWIVGNETNHAGERPGGANGEVITPDKYAQCFAKCRAAIKKLAGHAGDWVVPAAAAPWNNQTAYPSNPSGDWVKYFQDILNQCIALGQMPDALSLHTYTHGFNADLITSEDKWGAPFQNYHAHFRTYRDFLGVIPASLKAAPVFITETQAADPDWWRDQNSGWIRAAFKEINDWNAVQSNQPIQALCLFRWETGEPLWSISDKNGLKDDFRGALKNNYPVRWAPPPPLTDPAAPAAIAAAIANKPWMPINTGGALYMFAFANNLGYPQTDEFEFTFNMDTYVSQVYNLGIVYVKKGDWGNVKWVNKPGQ